jgi:hypothetical protein
MKANELRIGNYVFAQSSKLVRQNKVERTRVVQIQSVNYQTANKYDPIPITEEWLVRFGFSDKKRIYQGTADVWRNEGFRISKHKLDNFYVFKIYRSRVGEVKLMHVHQLQNLYFTLTETELI